MRAIECVDQLRSNPNATGRLAHWAFEDVAHAKLVPDPRYVDGLAFVRKARIASDDEQPADARERGDDLLDHAVGEIFLFRVAAHIREGQDRDRRLVGKRQGENLRFPRLLPGHTIGAYRPCDVLQPLHADIGEPGVDFAAHLAECALRDANAAGLSDAFEPCRNVDAVVADLTAYDLYLRAYAIGMSSQLRDPEALRLVEQAITRDPRYGPALAWGALCCFRLLENGRCEDREVDRGKGIGFARRALEVAGDDPGILANAAIALAYFGEDIGTMMALVDRALALNPNFARGWHISGALRSWAGQPDVAIKHLEAALRLSPRARVGTSFAVIGQAHFLSRRFDEAVPKLLLAIQDDPTFPFPHRVLAACYAHMGRLDDAREIMERLRAITPAAIPDTSYLRNPKHRELFLSGLRLAAGETEQGGSDLDGARDR